MLPLVFVVIAFTTDVLEEKIPKSGERLAIIDRLRKRDKALFAILFRKLFFFILLYPFIYLKNNAKFA